MKALAALLALAAIAAVAGVVASGGHAQRDATLRVFRVTMAGETEKPAGDPVATGSATITVRPARRSVCYRLTARDLPSRAIAAHIHRAAAGRAGRIVLALRTPNAAGTARGCARPSRRLVRAIAGRPRSFYVNVHTREFPNGAIRGQLAGARPVLGTILHLALKGTSEPNASGTAILRFRRDAQLICYRLTARNVTLPTAAAHIHRGAAGTNGPVIVPFEPPGATGTSTGCTETPAATIDQILANPAGFYVNIHTREHPGGAIRAQLG
jgi:hypothetical protein